MLCSKETTKFSRQAQRDAVQSHIDEKYGKTTSNKRFNLMKLCFKVKRGAKSSPCVLEDFF
jgi:hypothetical protein